MAKRSTKYLWISILIHSIALSYFLPIKGCGPDNSRKDSQNVASPVKIEVTIKGAGQAKQVHHKEPDNIQVKPKGAKSLIKTAIKQEDASNGASIPPVTSPCNFWYGGIGVETQDISLTEAIVMVVYPGYPAAQVGLQANDTIVWMDDVNIRGDPGTILNMRVMRNGMILFFRIVRDKICY